MKSEPRAPGILYLYVSLIISHLKTRLLYSGWVLLISLKSCFGIIFSVIISLLLDKYPEKQG